MYDSIINKDGIELIQFKNHKRQLLQYKIGDSIDLKDGIYFQSTGVMVIFENKIVAVFLRPNEKSCVNDFLFNSYSKNISYPKF